MARIHKRITLGRGFAIIVIAEGAKPKDGEVLALESDEVGYQNVRLGGAAMRLQRELKEAGLQQDVRTTILGHLQRGGAPCAYDRVLASQFGAKAFEMILDADFGKMVAYKHPDIVSVPIQDAIAQYNTIKGDDRLVKSARGVGICMGD